MLNLNSIFTLMHSEAKGEERNELGGDRYQQNGSESTILLLWTLRSLVDESRHFGREDIVELCGAVENKLLALDAVGGPEADAVLAEISQLTRTIEMKVAALLDEERNAIPLV